MCHLPFVLISSLVGSLLMANWIEVVEGPDKSVGPTGQPRLAAQGDGDVASEGVFDPSKLRDITGIERLPASPSSRAAWKIWSALGLGLMAGCALVAWELRRRQNRGKPRLPADRVALLELDQLESRGLPAQGKIAAYHTGLSDVVRRYLEKRFQLTATRQTTQEFLSTLPTSVGLNPKQQDLLRLFLGRCDLAKFARADCSLADCEATRELAQQIVLETAPTAIQENNSHQHRK